MQDKLRPQLEFLLCSLLSQLSPLTLFERLLLGSKMNLQAASLCSPYAKVTIFEAVKF